MRRDLKRGAEQTQRLEEIEAQVEAQSQAIENQAALIQHLAVVGQTQSVSMSHSGPLPPPDMLSKYQSLHPEVYEAMVVRFKQESQMLLDEQKHRHSLDRTNSRNTTWGLGLAWGLMYSCFVAALVMVGIGKPVAGLVSAIVAITTLAGNLVYAKNKPAQAKAPSEEHPSSSERSK